MKKITLIAVVSVLIILTNQHVYAFDTKTDKISVKTSKDNYIVNEQIIVNFSGLPGNKEDWITLIKPSAPVKDYGNWKYTHGKTSGSLTFKGMPEGEYEVRVFFSNASTIQAKYPFKVIKSTKVATLEEIIDSSPARNYINSLVERLDELESLKNSPDWGSERTMMRYAALLKVVPIHLENVVSGDPNFNANNYKTRYKNYQSFYSANVGKATETNLAKADFEKILTDKSWKLTNLIDKKLGSGAGWVHSYYNTSNYLKQAKEINYPDLLRITKEGDTKFKGHSFAYKVQTVKEFATAYKSYYNQTLENVINGLIEAAYENKTTNAQDAIKYAEQAKQLSDAALLVLPDDTAIKTLNKDAKTTLGKVGGAVFAKIYTSDLHKENAGKIVFFNKKPRIKAENKSTIKTTYKAGDYIYAMAYLKGSFKALTKSTNGINVTVSLFVDGSKKTSHTFGMDYASLQKGATYSFMEIIPDPATNKHSGPVKYAQKLAAISPRNHTIKFSLDAVQPGTSALIHLADGAFKLDCSTGQDKLAAYAITYREKSLSKVYMPKAKMNNSGLANSMKSALHNEGWEKNKKVQRVVITGSSWKIHKHPVNGKILYRSIPAAAAFKTDEGYCKYWNLTFKQLYNGSSYGKTIVGGVGSINDLSCKNIFK